MNDGKALSPEFAAMRDRWVEILMEDKPVRVNFPYHNMTVAVALNPYSVIGINPQVLTRQVEDFLRRIADELSRVADVPGIANPISVEPERNRSPLAFYGGAQLCAKGVPLPPDDDSWIFGPDKQH